jgi:hypothetical protein
LYYVLAPAIHHTVMSCQCAVGCTMSSLVLTPEWKYQVQQGLQADVWSGYMYTRLGILMQHRF